MSRTYSVVPYNPAWPEMFAKEKAVLEEVFGADALDIQHIGSTSVPGMKGKPQIDILILVDDISVVDRHTAELEQKGYIVYGDIHQNGARLFSREHANGEKDSNVHVYTPDLPFVQEFLVIRDYLRTHPDEAESYGNLKEKLKAEYPDDYRSYRQHKDVYVAELFERAKAARDN